MFQLLRTSKRLVKPSNCVYDEMYKESIRYIGTYTGKQFKFKKEIYSLLDEHLRTCGVCNPPVHLGKGSQTSQSLIKKAIREGYIKLNV